MTMIEVKTADLTGLALDWAVGIADGRDLELPSGFRGRTCIVWCDPFVVKLDGRPDFHDKARRHWKPSTDWACGGPLIEKYKVALSPPTDMVHRNFGNFDPRNGWYESGHWGSTIFGKERKHRRTAFSHPDSPLIVAMRAIVQFELGDAVQVPQELLP